MEAKQSSQPTEIERKLGKLVHDLSGVLEDLMSTCKTTGDLKAIVGAISLADTYLSRALAVAVVSFVNGGVLPAPERAWDVQLKAAMELGKIQAIESRTEGMRLAGELRQTLHLQSATARATAQAYGAVMEMGNVTMDDLLKHLESDALEDTDG